MTTRACRTILPLLILSMTSVVRLSAQDPLGFLSAIIANVTDLNAHVLTGRPIGEHPLVDKGESRLRGLGVEVTLDLGTLVTLEGKNARQGCTSLPDEVHRSFKTKDGRDSLEITKPEAPECYNSTLDAELGIGYSQLSRFRGDSGIQGGLEELPNISLYVGANIRLTDSTNRKTPIFLTPYVGVRGGLVRLKDFSASVRDTSITLSGSTFEYGLTLGLAATYNRLGVFVEAAWLYRDFDGAKWANGKDTFISPPTPTLRLSTRTIAIGAQLNFKKD